MVGGTELSEDETYAGSDIYTKGSFFMHSLRYVIGDDIFFKTLKNLSTDSAYTYDNFVTSNDVENLFSNAVGFSLKPFFDFYLNTTDVIELSIKEVGYKQYEIKVNNYFMDLPYNILINGKIVKKYIGKDGIKISSDMLPIVDPTGYYLKKVFI